MLLDVTGILFAAQLVLLLSIGPYADYGNWRPWIMISKRFTDINPNPFVLYVLTHLYSWPGNPLHLSIRHVWHEQAQPVADSTSTLCRRLPW